MSGLDQISCSNCWFNPLQSGSAGLSAGYCVEHKVLLRQSEQTTCARHVRKDLLYDSAVQQNELHRRRYGRDDGVQLVLDSEPVNNGSFVDTDVDFLRRDAIGALVADYGEYGAKVESLAQLRSMRRLRAELAMLSLGRAYTHRCVTRGGRWTSGIHLVWWTRERLMTDPTPEVAPEDLRYQEMIGLKRQVELARWWLLMFRLVFVSDVGRHAHIEGDAVGDLRGLAEAAAAETMIPSPSKLRAWVKKRAVPMIEACLPESRYRRLAEELHVER